MPDERSLPEVASDIVREAKLLIRQHVALASAECGEAARSAARSGVQLVTAVVFGLLGVGAIGAAVILGLTTLGIAPWAAAAIVGARQSHRRRGPGSFGRDRVEARELPAEHDRGIERSSRGGRVMSEPRDPVGVAVERDEGATRVNELRRNVEDTRDSLAESLSTLKAKLSPSEMLASTKTSVQEGVRRTVHEAAQEVREGSERLTRAIQEQPGWAALATAAAASTMWYFSREPRHRSTRGVRRTQPQRRRRRSRHCQEPATRRRTEHGRRVRSVCGCCPCSSRVQKPAGRGASVRGASVKRHGAAVGPDCRGGARPVGRSHPRACERARLERQPDRFWAGCSDGGIPRKRRRDPGGLLRPGYRVGTADGGSCEGVDSAGA